MPLIPDFPHLLHGGDYNPDQWIRTPEVIEEDFRLMQAAGCNTFTVGVFAWALLEPEEGRYDFAFLDGIMDRMAAAGHNVILATPTGARPFWMGEKYEEVRRVGRDGRRDILRGRHNHCWTSPVFREKARAIGTALARRYAGHAALKMWHLSNEYNGECFCPLCLEAFRTWLRGRYESLDALNAAWWTNFWAHRITAWEQIDPRDDTLDGLALDWRRFVSWQAIDFYQWEAQAVREHAPGVPVLTNLMGFYDGIDYHALAPHLDIVADDSYPLLKGPDPDLAWHASQTGMRFDMLRCLKGEPRPWFLMESCVDGCTVWSSIKLKDPGLHHLEMFQALAHGAEGTLYFQWRKGRGGREKYHGSVIGHTHAEETRVFREVQALSAREERIAEVIGSLNRAEVAMIVDWESRWAYQASAGVPDPHGVVAHAGGQYLPFWRRGVTVDVISSAHDFSGYRLLVVPRLYLLQPGVAARIRAFVGGGGSVVLTALTGMVNETNLCWNDGCPGDGLEELAGVWMEEVDVQEFGEAQQVAAAEGNALGLSGSWLAGKVCAVLRPRTAAALLHYAGGWKAGAPAATVRETGAGRVYFLGVDVTDALGENFYEAIIRREGLRAFTADGAALPRGVTAQRRVKDGAAYWFLLNFSREARLVPVAETAVDVETGAEAGSLLALSPWEARVLRVSGPQG